MLCLNFILAFCISCGLARPQIQPPAQTQNEDEPEPVVNATKVTLIPFYGGGKGQSLQITESAAGEILSSVIVKTPESQPPPPLEQTEVEINPYELENPPLPNRFETDHFEGYDGYIRRIQTQANEIVKLQDAAKVNGGLTEDQETEYQERMRSINEAAQKLAELQSGTAFENREGLTQWFERKRDNAKDKNKKKDEEKKRKKEEEKKKKEEEMRKKEEEKNKGENQKQEEEEEEEQESESVAINLPPDDASVAEAKPVGLAVAGEGGVAASKPVATAVVGPAGLAIARPVATAIAGVSPEQALVPIYADSLTSVPNKKSPNKNKTDQMSEFLNKVINKYHHV